MGRAPQRPASGGDLLWHSYSHPETDRRPGYLPHPPGIGLVRIYFPSRWRAPIYTKRLRPAYDPPAGISFRGCDAFRDHYLCIVISVITRKARPNPTVA